MITLYKHIAISGSVCSGKGTLARNLKSYLAPEGWRFFSGSEFAHSFAPKFYDEKIQIQKHHHNAQDYDDETDRKIDSKMKELFETATQSHVIDAWIAGYNARSVRGVLKVLLYSSHPDVIVERIVNRDNCTIAQAKQHLKERETANLTKWTRLYGDQGFFDHAQFDLVIDTYASGPMETVGKVLDAVGYEVRS
jgi:cytidylate kinase